MSELKWEILFAFEKVHIFILFRTETNSIAVLSLTELAYRIIHLASAAMIDPMWIRLMLMEHGPFYKEEFKYYQFF